MPIVRNILFESLEIVSVSVERRSLKHIKYGCGKTILMNVYLMKKQRPLDRTVKKFLAGQFMFDGVKINPHEFNCLCHV